MSTLRMEPRPETDAGIKAVWEEVDALLAARKAAERPPTAPAPAWNPESRPGPEARVRFSFD